MESLEFTSVQRGCVQDGHGVRTTIFFKGCPFSCPWCCNPETLSKSRNYFLDDGKCLYLKNISSELCGNCERTGGMKPIEDCPFGVFTPTTKTCQDINALVKDIMQDMNLYRLSGGGITLSGGEPLVQAGAMVPLLKLISKEGVSCAIETTLYTKDYGRFRELTSYIGEWIVDLKLQKENYREDYIEVMTKNLHLLRSLNKDIRYRLVYVETLNEDKAIGQLAALEVHDLELIMCHGLSESKYVRLGIPFVDFTPGEEAYLNFMRRLSLSGIKVRPLKI